MGEPHVISALVKKRADLAGELAQADLLKRHIMARLAQIDRSLAIFGYAGDPKSTKPRRKYAPRMFKRGQLRRMVYDIRRGSHGLRTNDAIAGEVMRRMKWNAEDGALLFSISLQVREISKVIER